MDSLSGWEAQYRGLLLENSQDHRNVVVDGVLVCVAPGWRISLEKIPVVEKPQHFQ